MTDLAEQPIRAEPPLAPVLPPRRRWRLDDMTRRFGVVGVWALLIIVFAIAKPSQFLTVSNFQTMFDSQAILLILALAMVVTLISGDFDFSLAGVFSINIVVIGRMNIVNHIPYGYAWLVVLAISTAIGIFQALLIVRLRLRSFIVTLGSGTAYLGVAAAIDNNTRSGVSSSYQAIMSYKFLGLEMVFWIGLLLVVVLWYVYGYTPLGRKLFFVGANKNVARLSGINVDRLRVGSLIAASILAGVGAMVTAGYLNESDPAIGQNFLLPMASGALLGSTCIWPGRANPWGTFVATYFLVTGYTGLEELGLNGWIQQAFYGGALVAAVAVSTLAARRTGADTVEVPTHH